jgi:crotonobetaine/carnitine-CoA ligase
VKAYIVPVEGASLTIDDILAHCNKYLAKFKVPTIVEIRNELPKTSIGKVQKKVLRAELSPKRQDG